MNAHHLTFLVLCLTSGCFLGTRALWNVSFRMTEEQFNDFSCKKRWTCDDVKPLGNDDLVLNIRDRNCACQETCLYFGDCCSGYVAAGRPVPPFLRRISPEYIQCIDDENVSRLSGYYSVTRCPEHTRNTTVGQYCERGREGDVFTQIPVTGKTSRHTFKNMYCAMCHGEAYIYWTMVYDCEPRSGLSVNSSVQDASDNRFCPMYYLPPESGMLHLCVNNKEDDSVCLPDVVGEETVRRCEEADNFTRAVFTSKGVMLKNKYCAVCQDTRPRCTLPVLISRSFTFRILVDLNREKSGDNTDSDRCPDSTIYNPLSLSCVRIYCPETWVFKGGECVIMTDDSTTNDVNNNNNNNNNNTVCITTFKCPFIVLKQSEFIVENMTLRHNKSSTSFTSDEFTLNNGSVRICVRAFLAKVDGFKPKLSETNLEKTEGIVTFVGILISIVALVITLIVYCIFPQLRNIPGKIIISLSLSLLVADILMLVSPKGESIYSACASLAVLMHYFFLSAFFWMNVSALNIYFTFAKTFATNDIEKNRNKFVKYSLFAWLSPLVIVIISVILNFTDVDWRYQPAYGRDICWINNPLPLIIFFLCPLLVILAVNILCFTLAVKKICSAKRSSARVLGTENKLDILIYFKLSLVIGLTWVFGVLAAFVPHPAVNYIFIVLNTLQGVFICLAFVCTRRVVNLIRERAKSTRRSSSSSGKSIKTFTYRLSS